MEAVESGVEERGVSKNWEMSSSDSELSCWPSVGARGSEAVWIYSECGSASYNSGAIADEVVATRVAVSVTWAWRVPIVGGSVEAIDKGTVSVVPVLVTKGATVSKTNIFVVVRTVVSEGVGW
jgi:hypothetical protein